MRTFFRSHPWLASTLLLAALFVSSLPLWGSDGGPFNIVCNQYVDSKPGFVPLYGRVCMGTGPGCVECVDTYTGTSDAGTDAYTTAFNVLKMLNNLPTGYAY